MILSAKSNDMTILGVPAALFSCFCLIGAAIAKKEIRFAGYMLIFSALCITLSVPIAYILSLLYHYRLIVAYPVITGTLFFTESEVSEAEPSEPCDTCFW